jgi:hydrophobic/amphiphilic exporter-1 (mainly G- bacteria), HAE1 family
MRIFISFFKKTPCRKGRRAGNNPKYLPLPVYIKRFFLSGLLLLVFLASVQAAESRKEILPLTLDKALQIAMEKNKDILRAREYRNQVEGRYVEERAAALPQLAIQGGMSRDHDDSQRAVYAAFPISGFAKTIPVEREARSAGVGVNQLVYSFGQVEAAIRAAKIGIKTADDQLLIQQQSALKEVSSAFYAVLLSKELNALALQNLDQKKRHLDEAQKKYQAGTATDYDILAAKVEVENANPDVIRTENMIRITRENLRFLIGLGDQEVDAQGALLTPIVPYPDFQESLVQAWKSRPELTDLKHRIGISEELLNLAKAGNMPVLNFKAGYGWQSQDYMPGQADGPAWTIGMFVTFPFFDGLRTQGKVIQAKSNLSTLRIEETKLLDGIILQTRESVSKVKEAGEIVKGLSGTVDQAQRLLSMAEKGYEFGVKTKLDVDDAQTNLVRAQGNLAKARHDYLVSLVQLEWVKGTIQPPVTSLPLSNDSKGK